MKLSLVVLGCALLATGCVRANRFRYVQNQPECFAARVDPFSAESKENRRWPSLECVHALYRVGFIEFEEDGKAVDPVQEQKALALIDEARRRSPTGKIITVVYVHGWKNNASEAGPGGDPKDVERFKSALNELGYRSLAAAKQAGGTTPPIPIVGVYMAWRGKSLMGPGWFTFLSYWSRRNTANRIGEGPDFSPTLNHIITKVNDGETGSRIALIGHSFGARVLEHAIERKAGGVQLYSEKSKDGKAGIDPLVDLTLYVNSANDARLSMARVQALQAQPVRVRHPDYNKKDCEDATDTERQQRTPIQAQHCRDYPLLVAITSRGDLATKYLLRIANTLNLDKSAPRPAMPKGDFLDDLPSLGAYEKRAAAHMPFLQSHVVRGIDCPALPDDAIAPIAEAPAARPLSGIVGDALAVAKAVGRADVVQALEDAEKKAKEDEAKANVDDAVRLAALEARTFAAHHPSCSADDAQCRFVFRTQDDSPACFQVDQRARTPNGGPLEPFNSTAYWIMDVDPVVIDDHGDIWNLSFVEMLGQLMAPRGFFDPKAGRVQLSRP
jgi:hypothetical protein